VRQGVGEPPGPPAASPLSPGRRLALVGGLYAWQGLVAGFAVTALPNHYAALGASAQAVGAHVAAVGLPWILQPLWGPVVDRYGGFAMGRRRFWIVAAFLGSLLSLARLLLIPEDPVPALASISAVFLVQSAFAALADTATDGLIIDHVPPGKLGTANAVTRIGFVGGGAVSAAFFAWMLPAHGLHACAAALLAVGAAILALPLLLREGSGDAWLSLRLVPSRMAGTTLPGLLRHLAASLAGRATLGLLAACFAIDAAGAVFGLPLGVELIQQRGWSAEALSRFQAVAALLAGTAGTLLVGWWADRAGAVRALTALLALCALAYGGSGAALLLPGAGPAALAGPVALALATAMPALLFVTLAPVVMRASLGPVAATRFALFMASLNAGDVAGFAVAGDVAGAIGLPWVGIAAGVFFAALAAAARIRARRPASHPGAAPHIPPA